MMRLALVQMRVDGGRREANLRRAVLRLEEAADLGANVAVLPEALNLGWTHPSAREEAEPIPAGVSFERLREAAMRFRLHVCAGLVERAHAVTYNAAVLIGPRGDLLIHHRKLNELELAQDLYGQGTRLEVVSTPLGVLGVMICSDAFARGQVVSRTLGLLGADVILSPCAWAVPADHDPVREPYGALWRENYGPVARDYRLWIAGVSNVGGLSEGPWRGRKCIGCSMLVDPEGEVVLTGPYGEDAESVLVAPVRIVPRPARGAGWDRALGRPASEPV